MAIATDDLVRLRSGLPPHDRVLLKEMTLGKELWLGPMYEHLLENFIFEGGSKVKVLVGDQGTGKTHLLRHVEADARDLGYETVFISLRDANWRLSDIVSLYTTIADQIDREAIVRGLCRRVASALGYGSDEYDGSVPLFPLLIEKGGLTKDVARRELVSGVSRALASSEGDEQESDLSPSFLAFAYTMIASRMMEGKTEIDEICWKWFSGEKLEPHERVRGLYDRLTKPTGRVWIYSLINLIRLSGRSGLVLLLDDMEALTERDPATNRYRYTPNAAKDTYELVRQLIDDAGLLQHLMVMMAGRTAIIEDERRGLKSYTALWMRLQTGLVSKESFNPFADMVDADRHLRKAGADGFADSVAKHLRSVLSAHGVHVRFRDIPTLESSSPLRRMVMETALMTEMEGVSNG